MRMPRGGALPHPRLLYLPAVEEAHDAAGLPGLRLVVGHHHDGAALLSVEAVEQLHDLDAHLGIQVAGRLVGEEDLRVARDGAGDGHALALAAGELRREVARAVREAHLLQHGLGPLPALRGGDLAVEQGQLHVVQHVQGTDQVEALEDEAQPPVPEGGQLLVAHARRVHPVDLDRAGGGQVQQAHEVQQGGLPATGGAHDAEELAAPHLQVHVLQRDGLDLPRAVDLL